MRPKNLLLVGLGVAVDAGSMAVVHRAASTSRPWATVDGFYKSVGDPERIGRRPDIERAMAELVARGEVDRHSFWVEGPNQDAVSRTWRDLESGPAHAVLYAVRSRPPSGSDTSYIEVWHRPRAIDAVLALQDDLSDIAQRTGGDTKPCIAANHGEPRRTTARSLIARSSGASTGSDRSPKTTGARNRHVKPTAAPRSDPPLAPDHESRLRVLRPTIRAPIAEPVPRVRTRHDVG